MAFHVGLLSYSAWKHSPLVDEPAHLAAGLSHWELQRFDLYRVNPPLVRLTASFPLLFVPHETEWGAYSKNSYRRAEFDVGSDYINANGISSSRLHFFIARLTCIPLSLIGAWFTYRLADEFYGRTSGYLAQILWCFSPWILSYGSTIMPDVASASFAAATFYYFWKWLDRPSWKNAVIAGTVLGLAQLTKFTLIIFIPVIPLMWVFWRLSGMRKGDPHSLAKHSLQVIAIVSLSLPIINMVYGFEGSFKRLADYKFVSETLCVESQQKEAPYSTEKINRFQDSPLGSIPIPLPENYVLGIDVQKFDFEQGRDSYLCGQWRDHGWWYYHLFALMIKTPTAVLLLGLLSMFLSLKHMCVNNMEFHKELLLLAPLIAIIVFVSSQTGFSIHSRYIMPSFPFIFIAISRVGVIVKKSSLMPFILVLLLALASVLSTLAIYPHTFSYFNLLAGGAKKWRKTST